jgi:O-antigen/teichoic acid export membrane protein
LALVGLIALMLVISQTVYHIWIGPEVVIPFSLSLAVAIFTSLQICGSIFLQFVNGISKVTLQLYIVLFTSLVNIPLAFYLGRQFGVWGVVLSSIILFGLLCVCMYIQAGKLINQKARGIWNR